MCKTKNILLIAILLAAVNTRAQVTTGQDKPPVNLPDSLHSEPKLYGVTDTLAPNIFKPNPVKVVWMGAIIPGYGQIMNKKYWKLPLVYGGFLGCAYAVAWNGSRYQAYKTAYRDIIDTDPDTNSFIEILPKGYTVETFGGIQEYTNILKTKQDAFRRYRDLSIICTVGYYALTLIDAYVDAQLYDFDISPDLTLRFQPAILKNNGFSSTLGIQCSLKLK
ncbi:MAG TPA: DUF5683 domain-containing protein [Paludibacter sp.]|nr:DUF5683 domain-containing protein [Paludibacter sp.]